MSDNWPMQPKVYSLDGPPRPLRKRVAASTPKLPLSTERWVRVCAVVGLACGLLGWSLGQLFADLPDASQKVQGPAQTARAQAPDVMNLPFGTSAAAAAPRAVEPQAPAAPALPFTVVRAWKESDQVAVLLERGGRSFVARGVGVHGDYLVQVDREQVVFTYLLSTSIQTLPMPHESWQELQAPPGPSARPQERHDFAVAFSERMMRTAQDESDNE
jgi:hypothetical protein